MTRSDRRQRSEGFSLLELLLACSLGLTLAMAALTALFGEGDLGRRLGRQLREGQRLERALSLIAGDLQRGTVLALDPAAAGLVPACGLAGRRPVLQILGSDGRLTTYSVGTPPDAIWRGWVLMRCGRAFGADGQPCVRCRRVRCLWAPDRCRWRPAPKPTAAWWSCGCCCGWAVPGNAPSGCRVTAACSWVISRGCRSGRRGR
jgi:type II secretory pathway pseudopilin PulG